MMSAHFKTVWRFYFYVMFPWFIEAIHKVGAFWCCLVFCLSVSRCLESTVWRLIQISTCGLGWFPTNLIGQLHAHVMKRGGAAVMASCESISPRARGLYPHAQSLFRDPTSNTVILGVGFSEDEHEVTQLWNHCPCQISDPGDKEKDFRPQEVHCWRALLALTS